MKFPLLLIKIYLRYRNSEYSNEIRDLLNTVTSNMQRNNILIENDEIISIYSNLDSKAMCTMLLHKLFVLKMNHYNVVNAIQRIYENFLQKN